MMILTFNLKEVRGLWIDNKKICTFQFCFLTIHSRTVRVENETDGNSQNWAIEIHFCYKPIHIGLKVFFFAYMSLFF